MLITLFKIIISIKCLESGTSYVCKTLRARTLDVETETVDDDDRGDNGNALQFTIIAFTLRSLKLLAEREIHKRLRLRV